MMTTSNFASKIKSRCHDNKGEVGERENIKKAFMEFFPPSHVDSFYITSGFQYRQIENN